MAMKSLCTPLSSGALLALLLSSVNGLCAASERVDETYALSSTGTIELHNVNGSVQVRAWDGEGVRMEAEKKGRDTEVVNGIQIHVESTGDRLQVRTEPAKIRRGWWRRISHEGVVDYILHVPAGARLEKIETVNGGLTVEGVTNAVRLETVNGDIRCRKLGGAAVMETVNGSIESTHLRLAADARVKAESVNGAIELRLPQTVDADLRASTINGSIRSDFEFTASTESSRRRVKARLGRGGAPVELSTVNGGVRIRHLQNEQVADK